MKKFFIVLFVAISIKSFGQYENPYQFLKLESGDLIFEKVYDVDSTSAKDLERMLIMSVPTGRDIVGFNNSSAVMTAKIENSIIDYRKYGGKGMSTATYMNFPLYAGVAIVWKDNRYKVTVSNMVFHTSLGKITGGESFSKNNGTQFDLSKIMIRSGGYLEQYFSDLFTIKRSAKKDW